MQFDNAGGIAEITTVGLRMFNPGSCCAGSVEINIRDGNAAAGFRQRPGAGLTEPPGRRR
jgi:hypothetical protein